jgi:NDP-sugar pyrophosphorylase family protein
LVRDVYIPALRSGAFLRAFPHASGFFDIGTPRRYLEANLAWLAGRSAAQWAAPGSRIAPGVEVRDAIVGPGASIGGRGVFERSVAWPGARASAPISDAIVVDDQVVFVGS